MESLPREYGKPPDFQRTSLPKLAFQRKKWYNLYGLNRPQSKRSAFISLETARGKHMPFMNKPDFLNTLERMYTNAKLLYEHEQYYNCCYLSGYVLECALKYILCEFGIKSDGTRYTIEDIKRYSHSAHKLNQGLSECASFVSGIPSRFQLMPEVKCPYIYAGASGYPGWDPKYRYGEHPKWTEKEWSTHYITEIESVFRFIASIAIGEGTL